MPGSARWDQDQPEDSRESTVDLPRLTNYPESPDPAPSRDSAAPYRPAPGRPPVPGARRPTEPWPDPSARPQTGPWDETGSWPTGPSQPELSRPAPSDRSSRHSAPRRPAGDPAPASQPQPDAPDPALTELAERIRELQALAARPSPGGSEPSRPRREPPAFQSEPPAASGESPASRSEPPAARSQRAPRSEPRAPRSEPRAPRSEPPAFRSEPPAARIQQTGARSEPAAARSDAAVPVSESAVSGSAPAPSYVPDVSQSHANSGTARQDYVVSDPRAAEPPSADDGEFAVRDDPAPAPRSRDGEYFSSQGYTSGQEHRAMDRRRGPADGASMPADRPAKGSLAELRLRLERLPAGHPSSPYDETGARRPAPEQLRQLELPLADEDEHPTRTSLLTPAADDRNGAAAPRAASPAPVSTPSFRPAAGPPAGDPGAAGRAHAEGRQNGFSRPAYGDDGFGPDEPALIDPDLADRDLAGPEPASPGLGAAGLGDVGADEPDQYESSEHRNGRYRTGQYGNGRPDQGEPDRYEPGLSRNGVNGNGRNGHGSDRDDPDEYAGARPPRSAPRDPDDLAASGLMPRVAGADPLAPAGADPLAPAGGFRSQDDADTSSVMPRIPAAAGDSWPVRNVSRGPDDRGASGLMPRVAAAERLPARNGSRPYDDPEASGLLPRVPGASALPARDGSRSYGDPDASGLLPRVPGAPDDARPARNGSGRPGSLPLSGPPRGTGGDLPSRNGGRRDDPFSSEWADPDTSAGQNGRSRSRPGLDDLERTRTSGPARSAPARFDTPVSSPSGGHLPGGHLAGGRPSGGNLPGEHLPTQLVPGDQRPGAQRPGDGDEGPDEPPRRPHAGLTPEQEAIADQALSRYKAADGRNVFGGYGESGLTPAMRRVEAHLPHGRLAPDSEQNSLKSPERYKDKLVKLIARHPGIPAADLAAEIYDAARYTFVFEPQDYTDGTWLVHRRLKAQGFDLEARRNRWDTPEFKGIRTRWRDPAHDLAFEVQFHTPASWDVVQRTHEAYLRITDPRTSPAERAQLRERQVAEAAGTRPPTRCAEIGDFRADVR
jgi:hypothetical protein